MDYPTVPSLKPFGKGEKPPMGTLVAKKIAELKTESYEEVSNRTAQNAMNFYIKKHLTIFVIFFLILLIITGCKASFRKETNTTTKQITQSAVVDKNSKIQVFDQELKNDIIVIKKIEVKDPGWILIREDIDGKPGPIAGFASINFGTHIDFLVPLRTRTIELKKDIKMYATLLQDLGQKNVFEFPKTDVPAKDKDKEITAPFILYPATPSKTTGRVKEIKMTVRQFAFEPSTITVNKGDRVKLIIETQDVDHGIEIPGLFIKKLIEIDKTTTIEFTADTVGVFPFKSYMKTAKEYENMKGEIIVK